MREIIFVAEGKSQSIASCGIDGIIATIKQQHAVILCESREMTSRRSEHIAIGDCLHKACFENAWMGGRHLSITTHHTRQLIAIRHRLQEICELSEVQTVTTVTCKQ